MVLPNGDGRLDVATVRYDLDKAARVTVEVVGDGLVEKFRVGRKSAGEHRWRWDGRIDGEVAPDGIYQVRVKARRGTVSDAASTQASVDTVASACHEIW